MAGSILARDKGKGWKGTRCEQKRKIPLDLEERAGCGSEGQMRAKIKQMDHEEGKNV